MERSSATRERAVAMVSVLVVARALLSCPASLPLVMVRGFVAERLASLEEPEMSANPKSALQEAVQADGLPSPTYRIVHEEGADHDRLFVAEVTVGGEIAGRGEGKRKSLAEQAAAEEALRALGERKKAH